MQASEGGKPAATIFFDLDKNHNGVIDGEELRALSEKVAAALKSRRPPPDGGAGKTSGSADVPEGKVGSDLNELMEQAKAKTTSAASSDGQACAPQDPETSNQVRLPRFPCAFVARASFFLFAFHACPTRAAGWLLLLFCAGL